ncbi:unnamed protein product [Diabrotica balteata]|uniref:Uncharacterized protein n=1 Tax=Diabrotica balteata TaxID=107213 RepID=A0A9N9SRQ2_DIABA|nr:unnamed protein product [Diabrotica balteata]
MSRKYLTDADLARMLEESYFEDDFMNDYESDGGWPKSDEEDAEGIAMDFQKNLPCSNITTNDVYYRRQFNLIRFNIDVLSTKQAILYTYDESVAKKGAYEVCSILHHFICNILPPTPTVKEFTIFYDSCVGQNKTFTLIRFLHNLVTKEGKLENTKFVFPIRDHSYLECDRDISIIKQKAHTETPEDWKDVFMHARVIPSPFLVIDCGLDLDMFQNWTDHLSSKKDVSFPHQTNNSSQNKCHQQEFDLPQSHVLLSVHKLSSLGSTATYENFVEDFEKKKTESFKASRGTEKIIQ